MRLPIWSEPLMTRLPPRSSPLCCQGLRRVIFEPGFGDRAGLRLVAGRRLVAGPGVACPKSRRSGCEPAALETEWFPGCPPGPFDSCSIVAVPLDTSM